MEISEQRECPYIVFKLQDGLYTINSEHVLTIVKMPDYQYMPDAPEYITGLTMYQGQGVLMTDLRLLFGMHSLAQDTDEFTNMLEIRKQDHVHWVDELVRCTKENDTFTLSRDPHQCAFGKWYDSYKPKNQMIGFLLKKIKEPHDRLHHAAQEVDEILKIDEDSQRDTRVDGVFNNIHGDYMPRVLNLLDECKKQFKDTFHEMLLILDGADGAPPLGLVVDEVLSVEQLQDFDSGTAFERMKNGRFIRGVKRSDRTNGLILEVDPERLISLSQQAYQAP